jgi:hypothetical protein
MTMKSGVRALLAVALCLAAAPAFAQGAAPNGSRSIDGPAAPLAPETIARDTAGHATVRAIKLTQPLIVDGRLDDPVYAAERPFGGLIQVAPVAGAPSTERSDVWVTYDATHIYVTCRCWDSAPPEAWIVNERRRDTVGLRQNDHFGVMFDTFYDRRSGFMFYANPLGARADYSVVDEGQSNTDWNPVWDVKVGRFAGGWIMEMAIPFASLRYKSGDHQVWGLQLRRSIRRKNEWAYLTPVPALLAGPQALNRVSSAGTLVGLDLPEAGRNLEVKPYLIGGLRTDTRQAPPVSNEGTAGAGVDLKYGVTANLTADATVHTDFAQVEVDEQQVNLTRFNVFFPEKREFFLEGRGLFDFAHAGQGSQGGGLGQAGAPASAAPDLFYSRRIGINGDRVVPVEAGGRLTGKVGHVGLGLMAIRAGAEDVSATVPTTFTVLRVKRDIFKRSAVGAMVTDRSVAVKGGGANRAYGLDAAFAFSPNTQLSTYAARSDTPGRTGDATSYQGQFDYLGDRYGAQVEHLFVGPDFNPEVGFLRRSDIRKSSATLRFSPRPRSMPSVRKFTWQARGDYFENSRGVVESREHNGRFVAEFNSSDQLTIEASGRFERLSRPFVLSPTVSIAPGAYDFGTVKTSYLLGQQRRVSGTLAMTLGRFYNGTITGAEFTSTRVVVSSRLSLEPGLTLNRIDLAAERVMQRLLRTRADYAFSSRMFASALVQYNSIDRTFSSNVRYRWEYRPGSELFVVWTDEHDRGPGTFALRNRALVVKVTRLVRR